MGEVGVWKALGGVGEDRLCEWQRAEGGGVLLEEDCGAVEL